MTVMSFRASDLVTIDERAIPERHHIQRLALSTAMQKAHKEVFFCQSNTKQNIQMTFLCFTKTYYGTLQHHTLPDVPTSKHLQHTCSKSET